MAVRSGQATAASVAVALGSAGHGGPVRSLRIINTDGTHAAFIGPSGVTTSTGYQLPAGGTLQLDGPVDPVELFVITASSTAVIAWVALG